MSTNWRACHSDRAPRVRGKQPDLWPIAIWLRDSLEKGEYFAVTGFAPSTKGLGASSLKVSIVIGETPAVGNLESGFVLNETRINLHKPGNTVVADEN